MLAAVYVRPVPHSNALPHISPHTLNADHTREALQKT